MSDYEAILDENRSRQEVADYVLGVGTAPAGPADNGSSRYEINSLRYSLQGSEVVIDIGRYEPEQQPPPIGQAWYELRERVQVAIPLRPDGKFDPQDIEVGILGEGGRRIFTRIRDLTGDQLQHVKSFLGGFAAVGEQARVEYRGTRVPDSSRILSGALLRRSDGSLLEISAARSPDLPDLEAAIEMITRAGATFDAFDTHSPIVRAMKDAANYIDKNHEWYSPVAHVGAMLERASQQINWEALLRRPDIMKAWEPDSRRRFYGDDLRNFFEQKIVVTARHHAQMVRDALDKQREEAGLPLLSDDQIITFQEPDGFSLDRNQPAHFRQDEDELRDIGVVSKRGPNGEVSFWTEHGIQRVDMAVTSENLQMLARSAATGALATEGTDGHARSFSPILCFKITDTRGNTCNVYPVNDGLVVEYTDSQPVFYAVETEMNT